MLVPLLLSLAVIPSSTDVDQPLALVGGDVVVEAGAEPLSDATVLVRDGRIEAVGVGLELPWDAHAVDVSGLTLTPSLVDAAHRLDLDFGDHRADQGRPADDGRDVFAATLEANRRGLAPERRAADGMPSDAASRPDHRAAGFGALFVAPGGMALAGHGSWLAASDRPVREALLATDVAQLGNLHWRGSSNYEGSGYPATLMGVMAHLRQVFLDAQRHATLQERWVLGRAERRPAHDAVLDAVGALLDGRLPLVCEAREEEDVRLVLGLTDEFPGLRVVILGGREAYELADELSARGVGVLHDFDFGDEPDGLEDEDDDSDDEPSAPDAEAPWDAAVPERLAADRRARWLERVAGPARLLEAGVPLAMASLGRGPSELTAGLAQAVEHGGLDADQALALATRGASAVLGGAPEGTLADGAWAGLTAWKGEPLGEDSEVRLLVVDGVLFDLRDADEIGEDATDDEDSDDDADDDDDAGDDPDAGEIGDPGDTDEAVAQAAEDDGEDEDADEGDESDDAVLTPYRAGLRAALTAADPSVEWPVELDSDREPSFRTGGDVLIRNAVIHTVGERGVLEGADMLVLDGRIDSIGEAGSLSAPEGVRVVDVDGAHVTPGIIDCHAHTAIRGGVNEWTRNLTPEVTIEDEVDPDDVGIYRALAGGTTTARLLHGSANAIGGRHEVIKFRWGASAPEMVFDGAPRGVKFALGENPRQANWGTGSRFPKTRMGVEISIRRAFEEAERYAAAWARHEAALAAGEDPDPPRRDLRLEALAGILAGEIHVHSHCYRAHEIVMLIGIAEEFGFKIATFQHVLEGYKVAREIGAHGGLGASTFIDWWGFKFEAYDAIPYNPALVHEAGVLMSINSDSGDHIRRLYLEAAKAVRYGNVPAEEALAMVTLVPAIQLGIDDRVGSLEPGKDADFAVFDRDPFDVRTRVMHTFIDGELYFERAPGRYDAWIAELDTRIAAGRAAALDARPVEPEGLDARALDLTESDLAALSRPLGATGAASTPARPPARPLALVGGTIHTMDGAAGAARVIEQGAVLIRDGRIHEVREGPVLASSLAVAGYEVRDVSGLHVWPGLIDAGSTVGLGEISAVQQSMDVNEVGGNQTDLRASTAWHPSSSVIPVTRVNGITSSLVVPGGGGVRGQSALFGLEGWTAAEALIADGVAMHFGAPRTSRDPEAQVTHVHERGIGCLAGGPDEHEFEPGHPAHAMASASADVVRDRRDDRWEGFRELVADAREYARATVEAHRRGLPAPVYDGRLEAFAPYALGLRPMVFDAGWADQVADVLDIADELGLDVVIAGGREAWKVADRLVLADVPVLVGPSTAMPPTRADLVDAGYANAGLLARAGVRIGFRTGGNHSSRDLPFQVGMAVGHGLDEDVAVHALTAGNADILGLSHEVGRIVPGLRADLIVTDGSPLQITTQLEAVVIGGRDVGLASKHTELYDMYRERLQTPGVPSR